MTRLLYDLAAADETIRFSPYCWRVKLALAHKNLPYETTPWRFTEKDRIAFSGQDKVPVLVDEDGTVIADSQAIALYLEATYAGAPSLFGGAAAQAVTMFVKAWTETSLRAALVPVLMPDIFAKLHEKDRAYFRESREKVIGMTLEALAAQRAQHLPAIAIALAPVRDVLQAQPFLAGDAPAYADHIVYGALRWAVTMSSTPLLQNEDVLARWMRAIELHYGLV